MSEHDPIRDKTINLPCFGIVVTLNYVVGTGFGALRLPGGTISSDLEEPCGCCDAPPHPDEGLCSGCAYNSAMDGIEALILAHACAGIDIETPAYIQGIETAVQGVASNI
jgi:hypothetical protein